MNIADIVYPVVIVAPDGWIAVLVASRQRQWRFSAIRKYQKIGFLVASADGSVWSLERIECARPRGFLKPALIAITNGSLPIEVCLVPCAGGFCEFKTALVAAIDTGGDVYGQRHSTARICDSIKNADSFQAVLVVLKRYRIDEVSSDN